MKILNNAVDIIELCLLFLFRCPVRSTINNFGISISNEERSQHGVFIGRAKVESFPVIDGEPLRLDYRAKICKNQCPQV